MINNFSFVWAVYGICLAGILGYYLWQLVLRRQLQQLEKAAEEGERHA